MKKLIFVGSETCGPCKTMLALLDSLCLQFDYADISSDLAKANKIKSVPAIMFFDSAGNFCDILYGIQPARKITEKWSELC